jgi:hypothetical protein
VRCSFALYFYIYHSQRVYTFSFSLSQNWQAETASRVDASDFGAVGGQKGPELYSAERRVYSRSGGIIESHQQHRFQPGHQAGLLQLVPFASSEMGRILVVSSNYHKFEGARSFVLPTNQPTKPLALFFSFSYFITEFNHKFSLVRMSARDVMCSSQMVHYSASRLA